MKDGNGYITQSLGVSTSEDVKWVHLTGTVNVSSSITSLNIQLINYGQQPEIDDWYSVWFDDVSIKKTSSEIVEEDNYYPFGLKHKGYNITVNGGNDKAQKYKYNGKELTDEFRLNLYDYGARNYDPAIGRWFNVDPMAEKYYQLSPYTYVGNMPTIAIDPDGNKIIFVVYNKGKSPQSYTYKGGNFYDNKGKVYTPNKGSAMGRVLSAYRKIEASDDSELKGMLRTLETSKQNHWVSEGAKSNVERDPNTLSVSETEEKIKNGNPVDTHTNFNFSESSKKEFEENTGVPQSDLSLVSHEMRHAYDYDQGCMQDNVNVNPSAKSPAEIRAVNTENRAREIENLPKRTKYGGEEIDPEKLDEK